MQDAETLKRDIEVMRVLVDILDDNNCVRGSEMLSMLRQYLENYVLYD